jgi:sugar O-acyltransferase (sialic acid O-acetyltransferase NeuD family)
LAESSRIVIIGAGGHGREIYAVIDAVNRVLGPTYDVVGFADDGTPDLHRLQRLGVPLLGHVEDIPADVQYFIGIGRPALRKELDERLTALGLTATAPIIHPAAWIGPDVTLGSGSVACAGVSVTTNVRAGRHVHINRNATVGHDVVLGDYVTVAPLSAISGDVILEDGVELGTGVSVLPGVRIGRGTVVGAQGCVTKDLPSGVTAVGIPARPL